MNRRFRRFAAAAALPAALALTFAAAGQSAGSDGGAGFTPPLTAAGHPDLRGHWTNDTFTPLERPVELGDKATFTPEEAAAFFKTRVDALQGQAADDIHYDDAIWQAENYDKVASLRTSLIQSPRNGRLPPLTALGTRAFTAGERRSGHRASGHCPTSERIHGTHRGQHAVPVVAHVSGSATQPYVSWSTKRELSTRYRTKSFRTFPFESKSTGPDAPW